MRSKNSAPLTDEEREHIALVKRIACACCDGTIGPGGYAHHIVQGRHFITLGLCYECHQGGQGWHGDKTLWRIFKRDEWEALNITLQRVAQLRNSNTDEVEYVTW